MRETIASLRMQAFRAVPGEFTLELSPDRSVVLLGENGVGKSTIADALEFYFRGSITEQRREGRSILHHQSRSPEDIEVEVVTSGSAGGMVSGGRSPGRVEGGDHFLLRGGALAAFVDKPKGEKFKHLFEILGLGDVEDLRADLYQARNQIERDLRQAQSAHNQANASIAELCPQPTETILLEKIQGAAKAAGLLEVSTLDEAFTRDWTEALAARKTAKRIASLEGLALDAQHLPTPPSLALARSWNQALGIGSQADQQAVRLFQTAQPILTGSDRDACPLCGQQVDLSSLREHVTKGLLGLSETATRNAGAERVLSRFLTSVDVTWKARLSLVERAKKMGVVLPVVPDSPRQAVEGALKASIPIDLNSMDSHFRNLRSWDETVVDLIAKTIPPISPHDRELVTLIQLVEQGKTWWGTRMALHRETETHELAVLLYDSYAGRQQAFFASTIARVSERTAEIYASLHPGENLKHVAIEAVGEKGAELAVEFHGHRQRPPHAVLSESHLNSLGVALFLAMAEAFNDRLGFLVLDDIVNSFDTAHRGALARLLATEFTDWQVIVLTHDPIFFEQIVRLAPEWKRIEFTSWTYEDGPRLRGYNTARFIQQARGRLDDNDIQGAAGKTRRALEETLQHACEGMGAYVPFRRGISNDQREAGELLAALRRSLKRDHHEDAELSDLLRGIEADLQTALNVEVHASQGWASNPEMRTALDHIAALEDYWTCGECSSSIWTVRAAGLARCRCGNLSYPRKVEVLARQ